MKRFFIGMSISVLVLVLGAIWFEKYSLGELETNRLEIEELAETARRSNKEAVAYFQTGHADLQVVINRQVIETMLTSMAGFEAISDKGQKIHINSLKPSFREGFIFIEAEAEFSAFFYKGGVKATYYAFTQLLDNGQCRLNFRISEAKPVAEGLLSGAWLESLIVARLQSKLKLPELDLALGFEQDVEIPAVDKAIQDGQIRIRLPKRTVHPRVAGPRVLVTREYLGFFADRIVLETEVASPTPALVDRAPTEPVLSGPLDIPSGIRVSLRFSLLSEIMAHLTAPEQDIQIEADRIEKVWEKDTKILGLKVKSRADLVAVKGYLDFTRADLNLEGQSLLLELEAEGQINGDIEGKAYGLSIDRPFTIYPKLDESLPILLRYEDTSLTLLPEAKEMVMVMLVETEFVGRQIRIRHSLKLAAEELIQPVVIPHRFQKEILVPARLEGKRVAATRKVPVAFNWSMTLPEDKNGFLIFNGDFKLLTPSLEPRDARENR